jgi:hypothetical protein
MKAPEKGFPCDKRHKWKTAFCTGGPALKSLIVQVASFSVSLRIARNSIPCSASRVAVSVTRVWQWNADV